MNFHILAKKNLGPGVAYNKFTTVGASALRRLNVREASSTIQTLEKIVIDFARMPEISLDFLRNSSSFLQNV